MKQEYNIIIKFVIKERQVYHIWKANIYIWNNNKQYMIKLVMRVRYIEIGLYSFTVVVKTRNVPGNRHFQPSKEGVCSKLCLPFSVTSWPKISREDARVILLYPSSPSVKFDLVRWPRTILPIFFCTPNALTICQLFPYLLYQKQTIVN